MEFSKSVTDRIADFFTEAFGTVAFLLLNILFFLFWFSANFNMIAGIAPFDPPPFNLLTMVVSLEAIFLAIIVLMSQNRAGKIADIRQKMDFEIDVVSEQEITKIVQLLEKLHRHVGVRLEDVKEIHRMEEAVDLEKIRRGAEE